MERMSASPVDSTRESTPAQPRRVGPLLRRLVPWFAGAVLVAGIIVAIVHYTSNTNGPPEAASTPPPAKPAVAEKKVALSKDATSVARKFIQTAVGRKDLAEGWKLAGPDVRGGLTHKEWMTGNIPVVPYPIAALATARFKIDYSFRNEALIEVALLPRPGAKIKPQVFALQMSRVRAPGGTRHWVVNSWVPKSATLVPQDTN